MSELKATTAYDAYWKATSNGDNSILVYLKSEADKVIVEQTTLRAFAEMQLRHNKYKRCLAMASKCRLRARWFGDNNFYKKGRWALQWHRRWLALAEKFKPNNSTAQ